MYAVIGGGLILFPFYFSLFNFMYSFMIYFINLYLETESYQDQLTDLFYPICSIVPNYVD